MNNVSRSESIDHLIQMLEDASDELRLGQTRLEQEIADHSIDRVPWYKAKRAPIRCFLGFHRLHTADWTGGYSEVAGRCTCGRIRVGGYWLK